MAGGWDVIDGWDVWVGFCCVDVLPSPKIHWYVKVPGPIDLLLKDIVTGVRQTAGWLKEKSAFTPPSIFT